MGITITAFHRSPDQGRGLARDMQVRWALEELELPYDVRYVPIPDLKQPDHLALQPFGQIPVFEEDGLVLFESGAIVLHLAERHPGLLPEDPHARARAKMWAVAALSTVEPPIIELQNATLLERGRSWQQERLPLVKEQVRARLMPLAARLADRKWLEPGFSAGDLLLVSVLRRLGCTDLLDGMPALAAYIARGEARPAFQRAFADQLAAYREHCE
ncbi:glutathione S-transferase family protein [Thalassobaculum sp. OXR-137]|uniref:glutathione S-transferase family protein n=1 Tax=Thalassobaculum sp. OXR-137 TaxID=3100173 RepID=UPI002AC931C6|nr:glutathione S-transferase family protein [Thalassobaculum sp. OXR-137]WPZ33913.1 glutathione S-transferase family protein [Thalassobaculum sp. OXR-137]